jgi:hypothetical protein
MALWPTLENSPWRDSSGYLHQAGPEHLDTRLVDTFFVDDDLLALWGEGAQLAFNQAGAYDHGGFGDHFLQA